MAKFRSKKTYVNRAGGVATKADPKFALVSLVLSSLLKDKYYESGTEQLERLKTLVAEYPDKMFIGKLALYARNVIGVRSITHALVGELSRCAKGSGLVRSVVRNAVRRPDDALEIASYLITEHGKPIPNSVKRGLRDAIQSMSSYSIAKYKSERSNFSMVDLFNLVHPKPKDFTQEATFKSLMTGELKSFDTWENLLSASEGDAEKKSESWSYLLKENKLGYFALLRNMRNIIEQADDETFELALKKLVDREAIKKSLVFPFRFLKAIEAVKGERLCKMDRSEVMAIDKSTSVRVAQTVASLCTAVELSLDNIGTFEGSTCIVVDVSGSMTTEVDGVSVSSTANLFAAAIKRKNLAADVIAFASNAKYITSGNYPVMRIKADIDRVVNTTELGGGTDLSSAFKLMNKRYDRIIVLSDMQPWMGDHESLYFSRIARPTEVFFNAYKKKFEADPVVIAFDLTGYGDIAVSGEKVYSIAGFSDKVFDLIKYLESEKDALYNEIEMTAIR